MRPKKIAQSGLHQMVDQQPLGQTTETALDLRFSVEVSTENISVLVFPFSTVSFVFYSQLLIVSRLRLLFRSHFLKPIHFMKLVHIPHAGSVSATITHPCTCKALLGGKQFLQKFISIRDRPAKVQKQRRNENTV